MQNTLSSIVLQNSHIVGVLFAIGCIALALFIKRRRQKQRDEVLRNLNTQLLHKNTLLNEHGTRLQAILDHFPGGISFVDSSLQVAFANQQAREVLDLPDDFFAAGLPSLEDVFRFNAERGEYGPGDVEEQVAARMALARVPQPHIFERERPDGTILEIRGIPLEGGGFITTYMDITERHRSAAEINRMAHHDALTNLANRTLLNKRLEEALSSASQDCIAAIHIIDLDNFKEVNDTLGHIDGDNVLKEVADRLGELVRQEDIIARLGGDEFAVLQHALSGPEEAAALAQKVIDRLCTPFMIDGRAMHIGASIGIALAPADGTTADEILRNADLALYCAKREGRATHRFFQSEIRAQIHERRTLERDLRKALAEGELQIHYQPVLDIETQQKVGVEALVRWHHPEHGLISPERFIPLAEEKGLIEELGFLVLRQACSDAVNWPSDIKIAVNLSPVQFQDGTLAESVMSILAETGLQPERLELEITESVLLRRSDENIAVLRILKDAGISIVLDDFGTGYASLSYLRAFPLDKIKMDRSFVHEIAHRDECAAIACAVANLGRSLGIITTAEGVESDMQFELVRAAGFTQVQGFLFGMPCPLSELDLDDHVTLEPVREEKHLTARNLMLVRSSFSQLVPIQEVVARKFYDRLFELAPEVRHLFPEDMSEQKTKLMAMLGTAIGRLSDFEALAPSIRELGARHASYGTQIEHYAIVAEALLWTLEECLGASFTPETRTAWTKVYNLLSDTMQEGAAEADGSAAQLESAV